jgi:hypothetical protein
MVVIFRVNPVFLTIRKRGCAPRLTGNVGEHLNFHGGGHEECYIMMCDALWIRM